MDDTNSRSGAPTRFADGALAAVLLVLAVAVVRIEEITVSPLAILAGVAATLGFELVASLYSGPVRRAWARQAVRIGTVAASLLLGALALTLRAGWLVVAGGAALACYLVVLALVAVGVAPLPSAWRR